MKVLAITDPGKGSVYNVPFPSMRAARAFLRGPYSKGSKVVLKWDRGVECYDEAGKLVSREAFSV